MGPLPGGVKALSWEETKQAADYIKEHGIQQFINVYKRHCSVKNDSLKWGDEIEYMLVKFDRGPRKVRVTLRGSELLAILEKNNENKSDWKPEYADYMIEGTPFLPYGSQINDFKYVQENMAERRLLVERFLGEDEALMTMTTFPRLGTPDFTFPSTQPKREENEITRSLFLPDRLISQWHPRYGILAENIRSRRERKIAINIPVFRDKNTPDPFFVEDPDKFYGEEEKKAAKPNHVYMDAVSFGLGCSCLQVTFQAVDVDEARHLCDQLVTIAPIMLSLTAATPVFRGVLVSTDTRWQTISAAVDDRTMEESGELPQETSRFAFPKSRYDSIDSYISPEGAAFSDLSTFNIEPRFYERMVQAGIDSSLARHYAHIFCRDPLIAYDKHMHEDDEGHTDHFENIQSTNWQTMRFKPPPPQLDFDDFDEEDAINVAPSRTSRIGWRVEFRPMEVQFTDFENAAFSVFLVLLTRVILTFNLNFIIPISRVDENLHRAHTMDSVSKQKFYFRTDITTPNSPSQLKVPPCPEHYHPIDICMANNEHCSIEELTIDQIINGCDDFAGLVPLCQSYINSLGNCDVETRQKVTSYLELISGRANGHFKTNARWMRDFIASHPGYNRDSRVSDSIQHDMLRRIWTIAHYQVVEDTLLPGGAYFQRQPSTRSYGSRQSSSAPDNQVTRDTLSPEQQDSILDQLAHALP